MMRAARIENNTVVDLWEVPSLDCYGELYTLVEAPEWVNLGATWDGTTFTNPPAPPPPVPASVPMSSARIVLLRAGLLSQVENAISTMTGLEGDEARILWEYATKVERNSPLTQTLVSQLGLTEEQVDDLFRQAATL